MKELIILVPFRCGEHRGNTLYWIEDMGNHIRYIRGGDNWIRDRLNCIHMYPADIPRMDISEVPSRLRRLFKRFMKNKAA